MAIITKMCSREILKTLLNVTWVANNSIENCVRYYGDGKDDCRRALADIPPKVDSVCPEPCERWTPRKDKLIHRIKLKILEGGSNFGTPFRRVQCDPPDDKDTPKTSKPKLKKAKAPKKALPAPKKKKEIPIPEPRAGVQVSVIGADTPIGQYLALLLKQCPTIKKLRLYEATDRSSDANRNITNVVQDLQNIDTNCAVQAFSCTYCQLQRCLQNTDIVVMLECGHIKPDMTIEERFNYQAPIVKAYADAIATECPKAFLVVGAAPVDCMVPLITQTLKETGWYDPRKLLGSMAVPEMRASTLAARALCLEPRYTRVPCVGGTEGETLVPLFSKAVEYFDFAPINAAMMTEAVRFAPTAVSRADGSDSHRAADLSEAHALAQLVTSISHALLCYDLPRVSGFVETDASQVISPASFLSIEVLLDRQGIKKKYDIPRQLSEMELELLDLAFINLKCRVDMALNWYRRHVEKEYVRCKMGYKKDWLNRRHYDRIDDCAIYLT